MHTLRKFCLKRPLFLGRTIVVGGLGPTTTVKSAIVLSTVTPKRQFFTKLFRQGGIPSYADNGGENALSYIKYLAKYSPKNCIKTLEDGWQSKVIPFDEIYLREYFKACGELKRFDQINITGLLSLLQREARGIGDAGKNDQTAALASILNSQTRTMAGSSPQVLDKYHLIPLITCTYNNNMWCPIMMTLTFDISTMNRTPCTFHLSNQPSKTACGS